MCISLRCPVFGMLLSCAVSAYLFGADAPQLPENYKTLPLYELDRAVKALSPNGFTAANRSDAFVTWMSGNDWKSLDINSLFHLYEWVSADSVDPHRFSARWTGFLTAPATGAYTVRQVRVYK